MVSYRLTKEDRAMLRKGYTIKIVLPRGMGKPLYTSGISAAALMAREYKTAKIIPLRATG